MILVAASEEAVRALAYQYWEEEGRPEGRHEIHWQRAWLALSQPAEAPVKKTAKAAPKAKVEKPAAKTVAKTVAKVEVDILEIDGIGPKFKKLLAAEGVASLKDLAKLTAASLAKLDDKLGFKGRSAREDWISQAKSLMSRG